LADTNPAGWRGLLDELDRQLLRAKRPLGLAAQPSGIWDIAEIRAPFEPLGAMPTELVERSRGILAEYQATIAGMQDARRRVGEHLAILNSARSERAPRPVYLDQVG
jgi:hypothetical protein